MEILHFCYIGSEYKRQLSTFLLHFFREVTFSLLTKIREVTNLLLSFCKLFCSYAGRHAPKYENTDILLINRKNGGFRR